MSRLLDTLENGPSQNNGEGEQVWERAWSLDEIRKTSANWSLAADSGLFLFLQDFSQRMLSKTHEIEKQLDGLMRDTKAADCSLHTVFNDFLMLSNTQFIENRVYDEEVEEPTVKPEVVEKPPEQEKTRDQKEAELIPKVQEAVNYGLRVLDLAFEQLDIKAGNSDSEDEETVDRVEPILEPKDLYVDRPLPLLIGSRLFMEQDDVGLGDLSSEELSIDSDRDSVIESEDGKDAEQSDDDFDQEDEGRGSIKKKSSILSSEDEEEDEEDSDIFAESDKEEEDDRKSTGPSSFADELAARIKGEEPASKSEGDRSSLSSSKKKSKTKMEPKSSKPQAEEDVDELFKPPELQDEDFSPFSGKGGLFSGGKGLFDDDDEGDLFSDALKPEAVEKSNATHVTDTGKPTKKIPPGAVSIFPENSLFGSANHSGLLEPKENGSSVKPKTQAAPKQGTLGGLFDDEEEDDFFSGKSLKTSISGGLKKPSQKVDLFGGDDEDGDIFSESSGAKLPQPSKQEPVEVVSPSLEVVSPSLEKKMPAGAISMFGPGTKTILVEGLKKRQPSTNKELEKAAENVAPADIVKPSVKSEKPQMRSLFSDDEDSQIFPDISKSQSKPESKSQNKAQKSPLSIFDDEEEEEEDLFAPVPKPKSDRAKSETPQVRSAIFSGLFSDDEDQWMSPKPDKTEVKGGRMKASNSALPIAKSQKNPSLFDDDYDLFKSAKESSQKQPSRVSLLFEGEDGEDENDKAKGSLFSDTPVLPDLSTVIKASVVDSPGGPPLFDGDTSAPTTADDVAKEKKLPEVKPVSRSGVGDGDGKRKPVGAVSLFGGIDVLGERQDTVKTKSPLDEPDGDDLLFREGPPPMDKEVKAKKNALSLFDNEEVEDEDDEEEPEETVPVSMPPEHRPRTRSTGVFQEEELLFSQKQQRDNDPDVDLFATAAGAQPSSAKQATATLFRDDDEDDLFGSVIPKTKPKAPEKPVKPSKSKTSPKPSSATLFPDSETDLGISPAAHLSGAVPRIPKAVVAAAPSPLPVLSASTFPRHCSSDDQAAGDGGVSFETPARVTTLKSANKGRAKGAGQRRPQTRAARQLSAQGSQDGTVEIRREDPPYGAGRGPSPRSPVPLLSDTASGPSALTLPVSTPRGRDSLVGVEADLFPPATSQAPSPKPCSLEEDQAAASEMASASIFDDRGGNLFQKVKVKLPKQSKQPTFFEGEDDDDIFAIAKSPTAVGSKKTKAGTGISDQDMFQDKVEKPSKSHIKIRDKSQDASLFDDNVDIFADFTLTAKPKEKNSKKKIKTKSIFDDDMDYIFSSGGAKPVVKPPSKSKKPQPAQEPGVTEESGPSIFDDPLNALGGI